MDGWLARLEREIEAETAGLTEQDWQRAPEGAWSSAQILEHLGRSYGGTAKMVELALGSSRPPQLRPPRIGQRLSKFLVVTLGRVPSGQQAPPFVQPGGPVASGAEALGKALGGLRRMRAALAAAEEKWGSGTPVGAHFALGPMTAAQWARFHYLHGHHHIKQLRERAGVKAGAGPS
jgi:hypothetical protein